MMLWATLYGFILFADLTGTWTIVRAANLIATELYTFYREAPHKGTMRG